MPQASDARPRGRTPWTYSPNADYADDSDELMTGEAVGIDVRPAGFILRAAGAAIDWLVYVGLLVGILLLASTTLSNVVDSAAMAAVSIAALVFCLVVAPMTVEVASRGRSLGKLAIGARIVRDDGGAEALRQAFVRALTGVIEIFLTLGGLAAIVALLSPRSKRLGDLLAGTYSQYERVASVTPPVLQLPPALLPWAAIADIGTLPDPLARRIAQFLAQLGALTPMARSGLGAQLAAEAAPYVSPVPNVDPVTFLVAVAAVRRNRESTAIDLEARRMAVLAPILTGTPHAFPDR